MADAFHYTDKPGFNAIDSQPDWTFKIGQPEAKERPKGAYFATMEPSEKNLHLLCAKLRIPRTKRDFVFWFTGTDGLVHLNGGRGRDRYILYSPTDYMVERERQQFSGPTEDVQEKFE